LEGACCIRKFEVLVDKYVMWPCGKFAGSHLYMPYHSGIVSTQEMDGKSGRKGERMRQGRMERVSMRMFVCKRQRPRQRQWHRKRQWKGQ